MVLKLADKKAMVAEVADIANQSVSAIAADYRGLTVTEMTQLRAQARESGVLAKIVRNTLARRAVKETPFECLEEQLTGPTMLLFSEADPGACARLVRDFIKEHEKFEVKALSLGGKLLPSSDLKAVADLPTYDEAIARLMAVMKAPITKLVRTMTEPYGKLTRTVAAVGDKKQNADN